MSFEELFALSPVEAGGWTAPRPPATDEPRLFGGLLLGLAIVGACAAATDRCHSLHALFTDPANHDAALRVTVARIRDGGRYAARQVEVRDGGRLLLTGFSSHHGGDNGPAHHMSMPDVPPPEAIEERRTADPASPRFLTERMLDIRVAELPSGTSHGPDGRRALWIRPRRPIGRHPSLHQAVIAFGSDVGPVRAGRQVHRVRDRADPLQTTSLDHAIWFHAEADADDWMLHVQHCPVTGQGRGLSHGVVFTRGGRLVASAAQEFLMRWKRVAEGHR